MGVYAAISAQFPSGPKLYSYFVPPDDGFNIPANRFDPCVGDYVVTSFDHTEKSAGAPNPIIRGESPLKIARVVEVLRVAPPEATKPYMMLIPLSDLKAGLVMRSEFITRAKAKKDARAKLEAMVQQEAMMEVYRKLAESNPEAAELLRIVNS